MADLQAKTPAPNPQTEPMRHAGPRLFETLRREVDRIFEDFDRNFWQAPSLRLFERNGPGLEIAIYPAVDFVERDKDFLVTAELPGVEQKDIELNIVDDVLTIKAEKSQVSETQDRQSHRSERRYGVYQRSFSLPDRADPEKIDASFANGVLSIAIQKRPDSAKPTRRIDIKP